MALILAMVAGLAATAGCGSTRDAAASSISGSSLTIYTSVPLEGASAVTGASVVDAERLALAQLHNRIGRYRIVLKVLDDATLKRGGWNPVQTTKNAKIAALDPTTIGYIGDLDSGASAISIPILNAAGIPQISPASTAVGLTADAPGSSPGEPEKYYPTNLRTFARVVPNDQVQAAAQVRLQRRMGCSRTYVLDDGEVDGVDTAASFELAAQSGGLHLAGSQAFRRDAGSYESLAASVAATGADCVFISADTESGAVLLTRQIAAALPDAMIFASAGLAESTYADPAQGGIPLSLDPRVLITVATLGPRDDPASARAFLASYRKRFGQPQPYAIFGYEAMSLMLDAIARASDQGTRPPRRSRVVAAIFSTRDRHSVIGTYSIDRNGDTTIRRYGVYRIVGGELTFWEAIDG